MCTKNVWRVSRIRRVYPHSPNLNCTAGSAFCRSPKAIADHISRQPIAPCPHWASFSNWRNRSSSGPGNRLGSLSFNGQIIPNLAHLSTKILRISEEKIQDARNISRNSTTGKCKTPKPPATALVVAQRESK
jgi:hypothetical protein